MCLAEMFALPCNSTRRNHRLHRPKYIKNHQNTIISWHRKNRACRLVTSWDNVQKGTMLGLGVYKVSLSACVIDRNRHTLVLSARTCHAHRFCLFARHMYALSTVWLLIQIWWYCYSSGLTGGFAHVAENLSGRSIGCNDFYLSARRVPRTRALLN